MDQLTAHGRAAAVFAAVLAHVRDDQLGNASPCAGWTAKDVMDHVIAGNQMVRKRAGLDALDLPGNPIVAQTTSTEGAQDVFAAPDGLTRTYELPIGPVSGGVFIDLRTIDLLVHAWDLAKATGQPTDLDPELASVCLTAARSRMNPALRGEGKPFAEEQPCPPGATAADELAAYLGRAVG
jgi:uncharacterized protein (TIGR03086 family)